VAIRKDLPVAGIELIQNNEQRGSQQHFPWSIPGMQAHWPDWGTA
jgi:hypothetical protein